MAFLYVLECSDVLQNASGVVAIAKVPGIAQQQLVNTGASGAGVVSAPFNPATRFVRLHTDSVCSFIFGTGLTGAAAVNTSARMAANQTEYFGVNAGDVVAVCLNT